MASMARRSEEVWTDAGQSHGNLIYTTRPRPRIVAVSFFTIFFEALLAHHAMDSPTSSSFADKKLVRSRCAYSRSAR